MKYPNFAEQDDRRIIHHRIANGGVERGGHGEVFWRAYRGAGLQGRVWAHRVLFSRATTDATASPSSSAARKARCSAKAVRGVE